MAIIAVNGKNRRVKTAFFLLLCLLLAGSPHFLEPVDRLYPGMVLALTLGGYGLSVVLRDWRKGFNPLLDGNIKFSDGDKFPSVDVLVAARDEENVVERLVNRLATINYPKDKILISIIDDGSIDETPYLLKKLIKNLPNFQVISRSRSDGGGKSGALNDALKKTSGEWLFILDADAELQEDVLLRVIPFAEQFNWSAVQLRKSVLNANKTRIACFQAMEMAMDAVIQRGRLHSAGIVELRGNGQLLRRDTLDICGGFNEETVTDDLDLSLRLLLADISVGIVWDPPVQEEAVLSFQALFRQRQRWAEGGLQRFFDYWHLLISKRLNFIKSIDLAGFFLLQYALPIIAFFDLLISLILRSSPSYWPLSLIAFSVSGLAIWRGCTIKSEGPELPSPRPIQLILAIIYLGHWFIVIPWVAIKMAIFQKKLVWVKTAHSGN